MNTSFAIEIIGIHTTETVKGRTPKTDIKWTILAPLGINSPTLKTFINAPLIDEGVKC